MNNQLIFILCLLLIFYLYSKNKVCDTFDNTKPKELIPKIIIQTWKTRTVPEKYIEDYNSVRDFNKDYKFLFFGDQDIIEFLGKHYPNYLETYNKLPVNIQKVDFFRYIAVYHFGGFYFDLDMRSYQSLDELLNYEAVFPVDQFVTKNKCKEDFDHYHRLYEYCIHKMPFLLGQYAFGARKRDPFIKALIDGIHNNIDNYISIHNQIKAINSKDEPLEYVYKTTGPDYVTNVYMRYNKKDEIVILDWHVGQYFGKYAKHNYFGTWKNGQSG